MKDILDHFEERQKPIFTEKSFQYFLIGLIGFILFLTSFPKSMIISGTFNYKLIINTLYLVLVGAVLFYGLFNGVKSQKEKQAPFLKKYIGLYGNALLFGIVLIIVVDFVQNILKYDFYLN